MDITFLAFFRYSEFLNHENFQRVHSSQNFKPFKLTDHKAMGTQEELLELELNDERQAF